jgi:hypothetical protein
MEQGVYVQLLKKLLCRIERNELKFTLDFSVVHFHFYLLYNNLVVCSSNSKQAIAILYT